MKKIVLVKGEPGLYEVAGGVLEVFPQSVYGEGTVSVYDDEARELIDDYDFVLVAEMMYANGEPIESAQIEITEERKRKPRNPKNAEAETPETEQTEEDGTSEEGAEGGEDAPPAEE